MPPPSLPLLLPFSSPILHPLPTSASRLRRSLSLSPCPRPLASPSPSFAVAAVNDDEYDYDDDVVLGDCLVFEDEAFEAPDLDLGLGRPSSHPGRKPPAARGGGSLVPERWKDAVEEINLTKKEKRRIAHGLRFGSRLDRRVPSAVAAPDEYRAYREGRLDAELGHGARDYLVSPLESKSRAYSEVRLDAEPGRVEPLEEKSRAGEKVEAPPPPPPGTRAAPRNPRTAMDAGSLEDIAELFNSGGYVPGETEDDGKSARSRRKLFTDEEKVLLNRRLPDLEGAASSKWLPPMFSRRPGALRRWGGASTPRRSKREARRRLRHFLSGVWERAAGGGGAWPERGRADGDGSWPERGRACGGGAWPERGRLAEEERIWAGSVRGESSSLFSPQFGVTGVFPSLSCLCLPPLSCPISLPSRQFLFLARASCWFPLNLPTHVQGVQNQLKRRLIRLGDALDASTAQGGRLRQKTKATTTP